MANKKKAQPTGKASQKNAKAAAKVRAAQQQKRQRMQWSVGIIVLVVVGIVVLVLVKISTDNNKATAATDRATAPASVVSDVAKVPIAKIATAHAARPQERLELQGPRGHQGPGVDQRRQAQGHVPGCRVLPLLRRRALAHGRGALEVRHVHRPQDGDLVVDRQPF